MPRQDTGRGTAPAKLRLLSAGPALPASRGAAAAGRAATAAKSATEATAAEPSPAKAAAAPARAAIGDEERTGATPRAAARGTATAGIADQIPADEEDQQKEQDRKQFVEVALGIVLADIDLALPVRRVAAQDADNPVNAAADAAGKIARLEPRHDRARNDHRRQRVGQRAFEPVADLDADPVLIRGDEQKNTVILLRLAELPGAEQLVGISFNVAALQRFDGGDDQLNAGLVFKVFQLGLKLAAALRRHDIGLIDHTAGQRRKVECGKCGKAEQQRRGETRGRSGARETQTQTPQPQTPGIYDV